MSVLGTLRRQHGYLLETLARARQSGAPALAARQLNHAVIEIDSSLRSLERRNDHLRRQMGAQGLIDFPLAAHGLCMIHDVADSFCLSHEHEFVSAARTLLDQGLPGAALPMLKRLLGYLPEHETARQLLLRLAQGDSRDAAQAGEFLRAARFRLRRGFGAGIFKGFPHGSAFAPDEKRLYVANFDHVLIHSFDHSGRRRRVIEGPWKSNWGLGYGEGLIWICDFAGASLHAIEPDGQAARRIDLAALLEGISDFVRPETVCVSGGRVYVQATRRPLPGAALISFMPDSPAKTLAHHADIPLTGAGGLASLQGRVFAASHYPGILFSLDPETGRAGVACPLPPDYILGIAAGAEHLYVIHNTGLTKITSQGERIFTLRPGVMIPMTSYVSLAAWSRNGADRLYLVDSGNQKVAVADS
jgi:hypothetical protein